MMESPLTNFTYAVWMGSSATDLDRAEIASLVSLFIDLRP